MVIIMANAAFEKIKQSPDLPTPTGVALKVMELSMDENSTAEQIAAVIELDPAISSRLLKLVNSPLAGASRRIASVSRAVVHVGVRTVSSLAMGFSLVNDHREGRCEGFDYNLFWSEAVARASTARHFTNILKNFNPDEAFTCGLLSPVGKLAFACVFPETYTEALHMVDHDNDRELAAVEHTMFGIDHNELAANMMAEWYMPEIFCNATRMQGNPDAEEGGNNVRERQFARILHLAGSFSYVLTRPTIYKDTLSSLVLEANQLGITPQVCHEVFDAISQEWRGSGAIFSVATRDVPTLAELYAQALDQEETATSPDTGPASCKSPAGDSHARG